MNIIDNFSRVGITTFVHPIQYFLLPHVLLFRQVDIHLFLDETQDTFHKVD
nr:MAG TPA: hypothetical protein [Caudoviricetes sp.]